MQAYLACFSILRHLILDGGVQVLNHFITIFEFGGIKSFFFNFLKVNHLSVDNLLVDQHVDGLGQAYSKAFVICEIDAFDSLLC